jgi:hypothetical protein
MEPAGRNGNSNRTSKKKNVSQFVNTVNEGRGWSEAYFTLDIGYSLLDIGYSTISTHLTIFIQPSLLI